MKKVLILPLFFFFFCNYIYSQCSDPNVGEDFYNCGVTANLIVENATSGYWEALVGGAPYPSVVFNPNNTSSDVTVSIAGFDGNHYLDVEFVWHDDSGPCSDDLTVKFVDVPVATIAGEDEYFICGSSIELNADTTGYSWASSGNWYKSGVLGYFDEQSSPETVFSFHEHYFGDSANVSVSFTWLVNYYGCPSMDTIWVNFYEVPETSLDENESVCGFEMGLYASYGIEESENYSPSGSWDMISKPVPSAMAEINPINNPISNITVSHYGIWQLSFTEYNTNYPQCYYRDTIMLEFIEIPIIDAGEDFDVCGNCFTLSGISAGYSGEWLPNGCSYTNYWDEETDVCCNAYGVQEFIWLETNNSTMLSMSCSAFDTVSVSLWKNPTPNIINDFTDTVQCGLTFNDLVSESPGSLITGYWYSESPGVSYEDVNSTYTEVTVPTYDKYDFYWVEYSGPETNPTFCSDTAGPLSIYFLNNPEVYAGLDESFFGNEYPLSGEILSSTNEYFSTRAYWWTNGTVYFDDFTSLQTIVNVPYYQQYEFILMGGYENFPGCIGKDTVLIEFLDPSDISSNTIILDILSADFNVDLTGNNAIAYLFRDYSEGDENNIVCIAHDYNGNIGQVYFTDLEDGIYYVKSQVVEPELFPSIVSSYCYVDAIDELNATPIIMEGGSILDSFIEHPYCENPFGGNSASGIVGYLNEGVFTGIDNISVLLYDNDEMRMLELCRTNEDGHYSFSEIPNVSNISIMVSSLIFPNREVFNIYTGFSEHYDVDFIVEGDSALIYDPNLVQINKFDKDVFIFPNPAKENLKIMSEEEPDNVLIYDLNGRVVLKPDDFIDVSDLQSGIYLIKIWFDDSILARKFIKQ